MVGDVGRQQVAMSVPTAQTRRLSGKAEEGGDAQQRPDGTAWLCRGACGNICLFSCRKNPFWIFQVAVEKYEEVLHHLQFAQELHKTLDGLTMSVSLWQILVAF